MEYRLDDEVVSIETIEGLPPERQGSGRQGLDEEDKVVIRTFSLESIKKLRLLGEELVDT